MAGTVSVGQRTVRLVQTRAELVRAGGWTNDGIHGAVGGNCAQWLLVATSEYEPLRFDLSLHDSRDAAVNFAYLDLRGAGDWTIDKVIDLDTGVAYTPVDVEVRATSWEPVL
jgi:hypothetical protein